MDGAIRTRAEADLPALVDGLALVTAADNYPNRRPPDPAAWLRSSGVLGAWVGERDGDVLGHVVLRSANGRAPARMWSEWSGANARRCAVVARLFVVPRGRGAGLGEALLATAWAEAARRDLHAVLDVADENQAAVRLYERLGWLRIGSYEQAFRDGDPPELLHCYSAPERLVA